MTGEVLAAHALGLLSPGSEWRLHRQWFAHSAADLLGVLERLAQSDTSIGGLDGRSNTRTRSSPSARALERSLRAKFDVCFTI